jgi:Transposase DDE domain group 1
MTEATLLPFDLPAVQRKKLTVDFGGGTQSSDGGLLLLREVERSLGICARLAGSLTDPRAPQRVEHQLIELIKTRVLAICCGYEDGNDLNRLRSDPLLKLAVGRCPESGGALCSQSTMSRLENMPSRRQAVRMTAALIDQFCASFPAQPSEITLDIDDTLDRVHGGQQLAFWNAHHDERCFLPIHVYHVESGKPVVVILRTGKTPAGREVRTVIKHITRRIRRHWPATRITWRGDSHYGRVEAMQWCEANNCDYIFGFQGNSGLDAHVADASQTVLLRHAASEHDKVRACVDFEHRPKSWDEERHFIARIEVSFQETKSGHLTQATDIRYCVTSLKGDPDHLYEKVYCARGQAENLIKLHKAQLASDRTSCHSATANQVRLVLHTAAYWIMHALRSRLPTTSSLARCEFTTLRLRLIKIGARVIEHAARIRVHLPTSCPERNVFAELAAGFVSAAPS